MNIARKLFAVAVVAGCCASAAQAEVSAETDFFGTYLRTVVSSTSSVKLLRIWSVSRIRPTYWPLNPSGDSNGDLWPYVAENPAQGRWPWVTWSRYTGTNYSLSWSRWTGRGWTDVEDVVEFATDLGDAVEPAMTFDTVGRAYLVWTFHSATTGASEIYFSMFLASRWTAPFRVSGEDEGASTPGITVLEDGSVRVTYATDQGETVRLLRVTRPWTITDDITPFGTLSISDPHY